MTTIQTYNNEYPKVSSLFSVFLNVSNPFLVIYQDKNYYDLVAITGHTDGKLYKWMNLYEQDNYKKIMIQ